MDKINLILAKFFKVAVNSKELSDIKRFLLVSLIVVVALYFYQRGKKNANLKNNTELYGQERRQDLNTIRNLSDYFLRSKSHLASQMIVDDADENSVKMRTLLSKLEMVANDVRIGLVSEAFVREFLGSNLIDLFEFSKKYINLYRVNRKHSSAFHHFECLYIRAKYGTGSLIFGFLEYVINKPLLSISKEIFKLKYGIGSLVSGLNRNYLREEVESIDFTILLYNVVIYALSFFFALYIVDIYVYRFF